LISDGREREEMGSVVVVVGVVVVVVVQEEVWKVKCASTRGEPS
jgi:hypothetical protein